MYLLYIMFILYILHIKRIHEFSVYACIMIIYMLNLNIYYLYIYVVIYIDSQIVHHNLCFNLFILHNNLFDNQGSEINKNDIFLRFDILSFTISLL